MTEKVQLTNKIHIAVVEGQMGSVKDIHGRRARTFCGTVSGKTNPEYVHESLAVTCRKCLTD